MVHKSSDMKQATGALRPVKSAESLVPTIETREPTHVSSSDNHVPVQTPLSGHSGEVDMLGPLETVTRAVSDYRRDSPKCHSRSSSHDSYFERKLSVQFKMDMDESEMCDEVSEDIEKDVSPSPKMKIDSSLDISEIQMNFDLEENEMKIFSEDEAMMSTSVGSQSPLEDVSTLSQSLNMSLPQSSSPQPAPVITRGSTNQRSETETLESPTKSRRMSFKEKFRKFTSPTMSRKQTETQSKMVDSGVGFDSDSCSGSFENKSFDDCKKPTKMKDKIVSALSPESLRKRPELSDSSPKKKKSTVSPSSSPIVGSLIKRSKIEDDASELSSINMSPSIKFIDASSSYELGLGLSSETLDDTRVSPRLDDNWNDGADTVRENINNKTDMEADVQDLSIVEVQIHEAHQDISLIIEEEGDVTGPISIIGANLDVDEVDPDKTSLLSDLSETVTCDTKSLQKVMTEDSNLAQDIYSVTSRTSEEAPCSLSSKDESEISVSYAGATVSENESFGVDSPSTTESTNDDDDDHDTDDRTETIKTVIAAAAHDVSEQDERLAIVEANVIDNDESKNNAGAASECELSVASITTEQEKDDDSAALNQEKFAMEIDDDKNIDINKQKADDEGETAGTRETEEYPMETDMTILSAEISANKRLYEKSENKTVFNDFHFGNFNYESDSEKSESSDSPIESNTSERSECPHREIETSAPTSAQTTPLEPPSLVLELETNEPESNISLNIKEEDLEDEVSTDLKLDLSNTLTSPPLEAVMMRRSPSSPARNRSVRSDFLSNFSVDPDLRIKPDPQSPQPDIGLPPLPKMTPTPPPKYTGIAKFGPQPYNKPSVGDAQTILSHKKFSRNSSTDGLVFTAECTVRSSPSPQLYRKDIDNKAQVEPYLTNEKLVLEETEEGAVSMECVTNVLREQSLTPDNHMEITFHEDSRCMSLEPDLRRDMEVISPSLEDSGRRSTQGIPEVSNTGGGV